MAYVFEIYECLLGCCHSGIRGVNPSNSNQQQHIQETKHATCHRLDQYESPYTYWGHLGRVFRYITRNGGHLYSDEDYPHNHRNQKLPCATRGKILAAHIDTFGVVRSDEAELLEVVRLQPLAATIASSAILTDFVGRTINRYMGVPADAPADHFVLIVGYGSENGVDYWLCQNFWGPRYREDGYFRIEKNVDHADGTVGIARKDLYLVIYGHGAWEKCLI